MKNKFCGQLRAVFLTSFISISCFSMCAASGGGAVSFPVIAKGNGYTIETRDWPARVMPGFPTECNRARAQVYLPQNTRLAAKLVLVSGWTCGSAWFDAMASYLAGQCGIEVWAVDRRASLFEDRAAWKADAQAVFKATSNRNAALARLQNPSSYLIGKNPALLRMIGYPLVLDDLDVIIREAGRDGRPVMLGGWSDGVEFVMAYAQRDFSPSSDKTLRGHARLAGLVFLDENPEWGLFSPASQRQKQGLALMQAQNTIFEQRWPAVTIFEAVGQAGPTESPLSAFFPAAKAARARMTGEALLGWLYDGGGYDSGWSWLVSAGGFDQARPVTGWESGEQTPIKRLVAMHQAPGGVWEWFYPHAIAADYWDLGARQFLHSGMKISPDQNNRLPVFTAFSGFNHSPGKAPPQGIGWWLGKTGVTNVSVFKHSSYRHADILLSPKAALDIWKPLAGWMEQQAKERK
jgi:hypothetical protein